MSMMASHVSCHSNEILPYTFSLPCPTPQDAIGRSSSPFEIGGDGLTSRGYQQNSADTFERFADPALCITPEKTSARQRRDVQPTTSSDEEADGGDQTPSRTRHGVPLKVRFDQNVEVKHMSPEFLAEWGEAKSENSRSQQEAPSMPNVGLPTGAATKSTEKDRSPEVVRILKSLAEPKVSSYQVDNYMDYIEINGTADPKDGESDLEPISVVASDLRKKCKLDAPKQPKSKSKPKVVKASRSPLSSSREGSPLETVSQVSPVGSLNTGSVENVFARPEFHTTLRISREMKQLQEEELNMPAAIKQKLEVSNKTRTHILEKASGKLNTETSQFTSLIPVDVREDSLVQYVEREETAKAKNAVITRPKMPEELEGQEPDILEFFTADLQRETASYSVEGFPAMTAGPNTADPTRAFDVYKHIRAWEGW